MEVRGEIQVIAGNQKGFIINGVEGWFNAPDDKMLSTFKKTDKVIVTYEAQGKIKKVSKVVLDGVSPAPVVTEQKTPPVETKKENPPQTTSEFFCEDCKKPLKDGKFKKCYDCNMKAKAAPAAAEKSAVPGENKDNTQGPKCVDCGKALKDDKYTKCWDCNKKNPVPRKGKGGRSYGKSPEEIAQIQKGNALNAAAAVLSGADCLKGCTPDEICQAVRVVADNLLEYLKIENK